MLDGKGVGKFMNNIECLLKEKNLCVVSPEDNGMEPLFKVGMSKIVVNTVKSPIKNGDIVVFKKEGNNEISRVIKVKSNSFYLCKDNSDKIEKNVKKENIIGVISSFITDGKVKHCESKELKEYTEKKLKEKSKLPDYSLINKLFCKK